MQEAPRSTRYRTAAGTFPLAPSRILLLTSGRRGDLAGVDAEGDAAQRVNPAVVFPKVFELDDVGLGRHGEVAVSTGRRTALSRDIHEPNHPVRRGHRTADPPRACDTKSDGRSHASLGVLACSTSRDAAGNVRCRHLVARTRALEHDHIPLHGCLRGSASSPACSGYCVASRCVLRRAHGQTP